MPNVDEAIERLRLEKNNADRNAIMEFKLSAMAIKLKQEKILALKNNANVGADIR